MLADEAELAAALLALEAFEAALLEREASSDERELLAEPVAVASSELMDEAWLASWEVMEESADSPALLIEETADEITELTEDAALAALDRLLVSTELVVVVVWACECMLEDEVVHGRVMHVQEPWRQEPG